jgi:release factor glutamine methyltransferase
VRPEAAPASVGDALALARTLGVARLDAQLLLAHHLQRPRAWVLAHADAALPPEAALALAHALARRADGVPLAYLTGRRAFHGIQLAVTPAVLDPRPDTETLVDWALELLGSEFTAVEAPQVLDLGTGSGAIALAVKAACPRAAVRALDASADALAVAQGNARRLGLAVDFLRSDWWQAVPPTPRLHIALSNPPYVAAGDPHLAALRHEPAQALLAGTDGLDAIRVLIAGAGAHLLPGGWLLIEHGHDQAAAVQALLAAAGYEALGERHDLAGRVRCSGGRRSAAHPDCGMVHT